MGSCQSTEAASGGTTEPVTTTNNVTPSIEQKRSPHAPEQSKKNKNTNCNSTDPAENSHDSLDDSVKSFGSHKSNKSSKSNKSGVKLGYSSGGSTPDQESTFSLCDGSSVGSGELSGKRNPKSLAHSSSIIGLDSMIENRREEGCLKTNFVHMEVPFGKPIEEVYDGVHTGPVLGSGISGLVRLVTHKATGVKYAVKCLDLGLVDTSEGLAQLREEIFIMCQLDHPNIVRLEEVYESHTEIYLVQELCLGGELFDRLDEQPDYHYTEGECARLIKQMLCAVRYLHSKGIIHRDLKLENFLFSSTAPDSELKMIDFGLSKHFRYGEVQHEAVGTPYTVAPEVIRGSYDERCDIWAIGVIAFLLLSGEPPFGGCGGPEPLMTVRSKILHGDFAFEPADIWDSVSAGARDFIRNVLVVDPKSRPTARDAQKQSWLRDWANKTRSEEDNVLNPNVVKALVNFKEFSDMRKLLCEVLSFTLLPEQIKDLRKEFETLDTDGSGEISLSALKQVLVTNAGAGSLGALTEPEVEDIFNAMRVKKTETRIHWHEFIAAGLSQCQVDDRNLRLAFDRLDNAHKGYVTLDDIMDLLGSDALYDEVTMRKMWGDSMKAVNCSGARITYDDFLLLMKGQTLEPGEGEDSSEQSQPILKEKMAKKKNGDNSTIELTSGDRVTSDGVILEKNNKIPSTPNRLLPNPAVMPLTPIMSDDDLDETPLSMDDDDDMIALPTFHSSFSDQAASFTPPASPARSAADFVTPGRMRGSFDSSMVASSPELAIDLQAFALPKPEIVGRARSRSMETGYLDDDTTPGEDSLTPTVVADVRRAVALSSQNSNKIDENKSALQVNRQLYRAHRQMRLSVLEASKRFEEQQAQHARDMIAKQAEEAGASKIQAGLVMRRVNNKVDTAEAVRKFLEENKKETQSLMEVANKRGGRGRRTRKKTISDMSGIMGSLSQDELGSISIQAARTSAAEDGGGIAEETLMPVPAVIETVPEDPEPIIRPATVPGEFKKVSDPFGARGKYGTKW